MKELTSIEQYKESIKSRKSIIMFTANWCPDCLVIKPFLPSIVEKFTDYDFYTINRDQLLDLCVELEILGIPSFVAFKDGTEIGRLVSKDRKTKKEIEEFIEGLR